MRAQIFLVFLASVSTAGQQPAVSPNPHSPETMTKIVVYLESPDIPKVSFGAQPRTMYRAGSRYCRIEESPDTQHGIHGLVVINEPDAWLINLLTKTAQHQTDPGPTFNCRLPLFADDVKSATDASNRLMGLEFGREFAFFRQDGATSKDGPTLKGKATKAYTIGIGDSQLFLFTNEIPERPVAIARQRGSKREVYWYTTYEEVPFDSKRFAKPDGIKVADAK